MEPLFVIDMGKRCNECGKRGAAENGLCVGCAARHVVERIRPGRRRGSKDSRKGAKGK